jgi:hypothetical protein
VTLRPLPRSRLDGLIPSIVATQHFVALVPLTGDARWAANASWSVARAAARGGRPVALVDLCIEEPQLHTAAGLPLGAGIVDAFQTGEDLTSAAQQLDGVFFIPAGAATAAPEFVLAHPRWRKLQAGFRSEDALLLVYVPGGGLARLAAVPEGVIALAPEGISLDSPAAAGLAAVQSQGAALLGVVRERWTPAATPLPAGVSTRTRPLMVPDDATGSRRRRGLVAASLLAVVILGVAAWALFAGSPPPTEPTTTAAAAPVAAVRRSVDSLAWTVQLAAYGALDNAFAHADRLTREHVPAFVTPVEATQAVWYRVLAGAFPSRDSAIAARQQLWDRDLVRRGQGELLRAPYSLALPERADLDSLRRIGVAAVRLHAGGRLLLGAFETPEQSALARRQLAQAGIPASLIARMEVNP